MDLSLPGMSGIEATREVARRFPSVAVLVVTVAAGDGDVLAGDTEALRTCITRIRNIASVFDAYRVTPTD